MEWFNRLRAEAPQFAPAITIYELDGVFYSLYPDLVKEHDLDFGTATISLCPDCEAAHAKSQPGKYSVAAGCDLGCLSRIGLPKLTIAERHCISTQRLLFSAIELPVGYTDYATTKGHYIAFAHTGPESVAERLSGGTMPNPDFAKRSIFVTLLGPDKNARSSPALEAALRQGGCLSVDPDKLYLWLSFLKWANPDPQYQRLSDTPALRACLAGLGRELVDEATVLVVSEDTSKHTAIATDDITRERAAGGNGAGAGAGAGSSSAGPDSASADASSDGIDHDIIPMVLVTESGSINSRLATERALKSIRIIRGEELARYLYTTSEASVPATASKRCVRDARFVAGVPSARPEC